MINGEEVDREPNAAMCAGKTIGASSGIRTLLSRASNGEKVLATTVGMSAEWEKVWSQLGDSNPGPAVYETVSGHFQPFSKTPSFVLFFPQMSASSRLSPILYVAVQCRLFSLLLSSL
jgi:hypothetical protein